MTTIAADVSTAQPSFDWKPQPEAQKLVDELLADFLDRLPPAARLAERMKAETGTRFKDWVRSIHVPDDADLERRLVEVGFRRDEDVLARKLFEHPGALFPYICLETAGPAADRVTVAIKVERVADFLAAHDLPLAGEVYGDPGEAYRSVDAWSSDDATLQAVEEHAGHLVKSNGRPDHAVTREAARVLERFTLRRRAYPTPEEAFAELHAMIDEAVEKIGRNWTADLFFQAERRFWMKRNRAAQVQYGRQQTLGLGWANHDHHTYRCSRANFANVIKTLEKLGFHCRERFYAGAEAGWGAQVLEHSGCGFVIFADVDMSGDEVKGDFAHEGFATRFAARADGKDGLGTVGLWVALHGESLLEAGMHHLECQFDWHALTEQLGEKGVGMMAPFTTFPFLRQAFTEGEKWQVPEERLSRLVGEGLITEEQAEKFRREGALGSHLENLERNDGFKGFNQHGVSDIISRTDARR